MEYDDLDEPADEFESKTFHVGCFNGHERTGYARGSPIHAAPTVSTGSFFQPRLTTFATSFNISGDRCREQSVGKPQPQQPSPESISLLYGLPVTVPIKLEDGHAHETLEDDLDDLVEPYTERRHGFRVRDDLDEPVVQSSWQRTRLQMVDDLDEPEEYARAFATECRDDLHEPADLPLPAPVASVHDLRDDLDEPAPRPLPETVEHNNALFDDLEEPAASPCRARQNERSSRVELRDDLADPDVDDHASHQRGTGSKLDHLYDDLDEVLVDELISEVSDLMLQSHGSVHEGAETTCRFSRESTASFTDDISRHSLVRQGTQPSLHAAQGSKTPSTSQGDVAKRLCFEESEHRMQGTHDAETQNTAKRHRRECQPTVGRLETGKRSVETVQGKVTRTSSPTVASQSSMPAVSAAEGLRHADAAPKTAAVSIRGVEEHAGLPIADVSGNESEVNTPTANPRCIDELTARSISCEANVGTEAVSQDTPASGKHDTSYPKDTSRPTSQQSPLLLDTPQSPVRWTSLPLQRSKEKGPSQLPTSPPLLRAVTTESSYLLPMQVDAAAPVQPLETSSQTSAGMPVSCSQHKCTGSETSTPPTEDNTQAHVSKGVSENSPPAASAASTSAAKPPRKTRAARLAARSRDPRRPVQMETVLARIDALLAAVATCRERGETPELLLPAKTRWRDLQLCTDAGHLVVTDETPRAEVRVRSESRLNMMVLLLQKIRHLVSTNTHSTKRDIYYQEVSLFGSQRAVDALLDDVTDLLAIPRESSHVRATSKGLVAGQLVLRCGDVLMDCSAAKHGLLVPESVPHVQLVSSSARFILVVEKDATFQKILDSGVMDHLPPGIVITGKGFPDLNTRLLLRMLTSRLAVPAMALLDADPHGLEIFFVYKYGSLARARESDRLTTPGLIWLGVRPTEVLHLDIPRSALLPLTAADSSKARCLLSRPYVKHNRFWQRQIREILASGRKAEIQCLSAIHPTFLTDLYLPSKIQECLAGGLGDSNGQDAVPQNLTEPCESVQALAAVE
ncbi:uncharacterized protein LOC122378966 isoform X2 [Amphibalanus amphitrite]|uniref:uncharacterized protein LOC122378966 isoform X2 n=2 Tax=Amphibalanus amphitrite TaxID=1232801 RepID=UPI001C91AE43|nr:uncharacterized protein LOC122378966 isoform X2 [Amphibalanus amphitrite]